MLGHLCCCRCFILQWWDEGRKLEMVAIPGRLSEIEISAWLAANQRWQTLRPECQGCCPGKRISGALMRRAYFIEEEMFRRVGEMLRYKYSDSNGMKSLKSCGWLLLAELTLLTTIEFYGISRAYRQLIAFQEIISNDCQGERRIFITKNLQSVWWKFRHLIWCSSGLK